MKKKRKKKKEQNIDKDEKKRKEMVSDRHIKQRRKWIYDNHEGGATAAPIAQGIGRRAANCTQYACVILLAVHTSLTCIHSRGCSECITT